MKDILRIIGALGDPVRLRLLRLLRGRELCVCELVDTLRLPQYAISRHLRSLRTLGLVTARRDGRWMHYRLGSEVRGRGPAAELLTVLCRHCEDERAFRRDDVRLRRRLAIGRMGRCAIVSGSKDAASKRGKQRRMENE